MTTGIGDNSTAPELLRSLTERIERLMDEKDALAGDIKEIFIEANSNGFDVRALRAVIRLKRADQTALAEHEALIELYKKALGMLADTPLGEAAIRRAGAA